MHGENLLYRFGKRVCTKMKNQDKQLKAEKKGGGPIGPEASYDTGILNLAEGFVNWGG